MNRQYHGFQSSHVSFNKVLNTKSRSFLGGLSSAEQQFADDHQFFFKNYCFFQFYDFKDPWYKEVINVRRFAFKRIFNENIVIRRHGSNQKYLFQYFF